MLHQQLIQKFISIFPHIKYGNINITTPDGKNYFFTGTEDGPSAELVIHDHRAIRKFIAKGDIGFAESYQYGWWDSKDLVSLFMFSIKNESLLKNYIYGGVITKIISKLAYLLRLNTIKGSKKNIHDHYDLGNDFYELWLDPSMTYSSAIFSNPTEDLQCAQYRKYDRIINQLDSSGTLLEIGCGWGGFAERALKTGKYNIKAITISPQQYFYAKQRLQGIAVVSNEDYRIQQGKYQHIVSIEMFEAVGEKFWSTYFAKIKSLLATKGTAIIQTITIADEYFVNYRNSGDAIRTFIFPGGMLPSREKFIAASSKAGLKVIDEFSFGQDYAKTLSVWMLSFTNKITQITALGFDEKFIRIWQFYLNFCLAGFKSGRINVMQITLQHAN